MSTQRRSPAEVARGRLTTRPRVINGPEALTGPNVTPVRDLSEAMHGSFAMRPVSDEHRTLVRRPDILRIQPSKIVGRSTGCVLAAVLGTMTAPRRITPDHASMVTRRCSERRFFLRPDDEAMNAYFYCLIEAAQTTDVQVVMAQMMSNHTHENALPRGGTIVDFYQRFHLHLAKCINMQRGRWENMWSSQPTNIVEATDKESWIDQLVYIATNPVKAHLVDTVAHWPASRFVFALLNKRTIRATRPRFFRSDGPMPEVVEMTPTIPPELGDPDEIIAEVRRRIAVVEEKCARERAKTGRRIVGRRTILRQSWRDCPTSHEPRRGMRPRVAGRSKWAVLEAVQRNKVFEAEYRDARELWKAGLQAVFPRGTFWLARHANITVRETDTPPPLASPPGLAPIA